MVTGDTCVLALDSVPCRAYKNHARAWCAAIGGENWYPVTLVRDSYFEDYAQELAEELDLVKRDVHWPYNCIDWEQAARELKQDYSSADFDGVTYWYRSA